VDDLVQAFIAEKVLQRDLVSAADRARGRFRAFLVTALNNFASNQTRADSAARRRPAGDGDVCRVVSADAAWLADLAGAAAAAPDPFDLDWARQTLSEAVSRMQAQCVADGREDLWELFELRVLVPSLNDVPPADYEQIVGRFSYATPKQAANALVTAKRRFAQALRSVLAEYSADDEEVELEFARLGELLAAAGRNPNR
jgi:RNA polymerase sigma-70 factor (ECF subfamily)